MPSREDELYSEIGRVLFESAPENAQMIFLDAELAGEDDHAKFLYDFIDERDEKSWFFPETPLTDNLLLEKLTELRKVYYKQGLTNGLPIWHGCIVTVDLKKMKITFQYRYD